MEEQEFRSKGFDCSPSPIEMPSPTVAPETNYFQIVYNVYSAEPKDTMHRHGGATLNRDAAMAEAVSLARRHDVQEVFVVTVHAAYSKEVNIKKVI